MEKGENARDIDLERDGDRTIRTILHGVVSKKFLTSMGSLAASGTMRAFVWRFKTRSIKSSHLPFSFSISFALFSSLKSATDYSANLREIDDDWAT